MRLGKINIAERSKWAKLLLYGALTFAAFTVADLLIIYFRDRFIPTQAPPKKISQARPEQQMDRSQYSTVTGRNLFSSSGTIPEAITAKTSTDQKEADPIPSTLPLNLIGTLVHSNPARSIAAIEVKSKNLTGSYLTSAEIEGLAKVERVERHRVYIRNSSTGAAEYIELNKGGNKVSFDASKVSAPTKPANQEVISTGNNHFQIKRSDLLKYTNDLSSVLMQARAVANKDPVTGEVNGFRLLDFQPGSIFEQLGFQRMDIIKGVNGEPVDSIQKAMELFQILKNAEQVKLMVDRGGKNENFVYDVSK